MTRNNPRSEGSRWVRRLLLALVVATCVRVWLGPGSLVPQAAAQIPDSGAQRVEQIKLLRENNRLLSQILATLKSGTLNVRVASTDKTSKGVAAPRQPRG